MRGSGGGANRSRVRFAKTTPKTCNTGYRRSNIINTSQNVNTPDDDHTMSAPKEHNIHKGSHHIDTKLKKVDSSNLRSNAQSKDKKLPDCSKNLRDVYQAKGEILRDDASTSKALLPDVRDKDSTEPNCSMAYLKNNNAPNNIVLDDVSAGETSILNSNVHNEDKKIPDCSKNLRDVYQVKGKIFHDNASMNTALSSNVCDKDNTEPNCSKNYSKIDNTLNNIAHENVSAGETLVINSNNHSEDKKIPDCSKNFQDVYQVGGKIFHNNAFTSKALPSDVCYKDITESNCSKNYSKNDNTLNNIAHEDISAGKTNCSKNYSKNDNTLNNIAHKDVSAGETLVINSNVRSEDKKIPDFSKNLRGVNQVEEKIFHDNASKNKMLLQDVCKKDITGIHYRTGKNRGKPEDTTYASDELPESTTN